MTTKLGCCDATCWRKQNKEAQRGKTGWSERKYTQEADEEDVTFTTLPLYIDMLVILITYTTFLSDFKCIVSDCSVQCMCPDVDYLVWVTIDTNTLYSKSENEPKMAVISKLSQASGGFNFLTKF